MKKKYSTPDEYLANQRAIRHSWPSSHISHNRDIVAYDGEGIGAGSEHRYVLLMNSHGDAIYAKEDGKSISTQQAFNYLLECKRKYPEALHVSYGFNYDVNMILRGDNHDVPYGHLKLLVKNKRVFWRNYEIRYVPRRYLHISRYKREYGDKRDRTPEESVIIWDFLSFFQQSFVDALKGCLTQNDVNSLGMRIVEDGKARRGSFNQEDINSSFLYNYCLSEVRALEHLVSTFRDDSRASGINLQRYDGAGAAASALLRENKCMTAIKGNMLPDGLEYAARVAYGGGRSELVKYGHTDKEVHHYDIIAAFPDAMPNMPDLSKGEWIHEDMDARVNRMIEMSERDVDEFALYKIYWDFRHKYDHRGKRHRRNDYDVLFPLFYRTPWQEPRIFYPPQGYSWVWGRELRSTLKHALYLCGDIRVFESYVFKPYDNSKPFDFIHDVYAERLAHKMMGRKGQALSLKLAMNAIPGKLAQSKGYNGDDRENRGGAGANGLFHGKPPYHNLLYAGYITSYVRAKVFDACMQDPTAIIAIATDGIWSTRPLSLQVGTYMGQWTYEVLDGFTSVQAGIYFSKKKREDGGDQVYHYRGFNQGSIKEEDIIEAWKRQYYSVKVPTRRFVTMGTALESEATYWSKWGTWEDQERTLQIQPNQMLKRQVLLGKDGRPYAEAATSLIKTSASEVMMFSENVPTTDMVLRGYDCNGDDIETYLSRPHSTPWQSGEKSDIQRMIDYQELVAEEIIDSEV